MVSLKHVYQAHDAPHMKPHVAIVILCYNGVADTLACLRSLSLLEDDSYRWAVVLVDNTSQDDTCARVREAHPAVHVIENQANLGYAAGNNVGLRYALDHEFDYIFLLNNDTIVAPDSLKILIDTAQGDPTIGVVGPTLYYLEQPQVIWSAGGGVDWRRGTSQMLARGETEHGQFCTPRDVDFVTGCAMLVRRKVLEHAGLFDERFFLYFEETEWCVRVQRQGFRIVHVPQAHIWHNIPVTDRVDRPYVAYYMTRNRLLFLRLTGTPPTTWLHALILQDLRTCLSYSVRPKWRNRRPQLRAMLLGVRDFWLGRFGGVTYHWQ